MRLKILTGHMYLDHDEASLPLSCFTKNTNSSVSSETESLESQSTFVSDASFESNSSTLSHSSCHLQPKRRKLCPKTNPREQQSENAINILTSDFKGLYHDPDFSDLELQCETITFRTHRAILSARSPVFKAMLSGNMREAACGYMEVEDLDPRTLGRFLSFLYSGTTGQDALRWKEAAKLYYAADKYLVPSLKEECAAVLRNNISLENVCDILSLADRHQDKELLSVVHDFMDG